MAFELERILYETEDFLRRNLGSSSRRAAKKRRAQRQFMEVDPPPAPGRADPRRPARPADRRPASLFGGIGFFTWVVALPTALADRPDLPLLARRPQGAETADPSGAPALPLAELAARAEEGLLDRCPELPGRALGAADAILARLAELQPHLGELDPQSVLAGDARRLIGQHLPRLVDSYLELPASARASGL